MITKSLYIYIYYYYIYIVLVSSLLLYYNIILTDKEDVLINSCCPGHVRTDMAGPNAPLSPDEGAETPVLLALLPAGSPNGGFWEHKALSKW